MSDKVELFVDVMRVFLRRKRAEAEQSAQSLKILSVIYNTVGETSRMSYRGIRAASRLKQTCELALMTIHNWEGRHIAKILAAIDRFGQTIVWTQRALEHINGVEYDHYQNASMVCIYEAELLFLHAKEYEVLVQTDPQWQQAEALFQFLGQSSELLARHNGEYRENLEVLNSYEHVQRHDLHTSDTADRNTSS